MIRNGGKTVLDRIGHLLLALASLLVFWVLGQMGAEDLSAHVASTSTGNGRPTNMMVSPGSGVARGNESFGISHVYGTAPYLMIADGGPQCDAQTGRGALNVNQNCMPYQILDILVPTGTSSLDIELIDFCHNSWDNAINSGEGSAFFLLDKNFDYTKLADRGQHTKGQIEGSSRLAYFDNFQSTRELYSQCHAWNGSSSNSGYNTGSRVSSGANYNDSVHNVSNSMTVSLSNGEPVAGTSYERYTALIIIANNNTGEYGDSKRTGLDNQYYNLFNVKVNTPQSYVIAWGANVDPDNITEAWAHSIGLSGLHYRSYYRSATGILPYFTYEDLKDSQGDWADGTDDEFVTALVDQLVSSIRSNSGCGSGGSYNVYCGIGNARLVKYLQRTNHNNYTNAEQLIRDYYSQQDPPLNLGNHRSLHENGRSLKQSRGGTHTNFHKGSKSMGNYGRGLNYKVVFGQTAYDNMREVNNRISLDGEAQPNYVNRLNNALVKYVEASFRYNFNGYYFSNWGITLESAPNCNSTDRSRFALYDVDTGRHHTGTRPRVRILHADRGSSNWSEMRVSVENDFKTKSGTGMRVDYVTNSGSNGDPAIFQFWDPDGSTTNNNKWAWFEWKTDHNKQYRYVLSNVDVRDYIRVGLPHPQRNVLQSNCGSDIEVKVQKITNGCNVKIKKLFHREGTNRPDLNIGLTQVPNTPSIPAGVPKTERFSQPSGSDVDTDETYINWTDLQKLNTGKKYQIHLDGHYNGNTKVPITPKMLAGGDGAFEFFSRDNGKTVYIRLDGGARTIYCQGVPRGKAVVKVVPNIGCKVDIAELLWENPYGTNSQTRQPPLQVALKVSQHSTKGTKGALSKRKKMSQIRPPSGVAVTYLSETEVENLPVDVIYEVVISGYYKNNSVTSFTSPLDPHYPLKNDGLGKTKDLDILIRHETSGAAPNIVHYLYDNGSKKQCNQPPPPPNPDCRTPTSGRITWTSTNDNALTNAKYEITGTTMTDKIPQTDTQRATSQLQAEQLGGWENKAVLSKWNTNIGGQFSTFGSNKLVSDEIKKAFEYDFTTGLRDSANAIFDNKYTAKTTVKFDNKVPPQTTAATTGSWNNTYYWKLENVTAEAGPQNNPLKKTVTLSSRYIHTAIQTLESKDRETGTKRAPIYSAGGLVEHLWKMDWNVKAEHEYSFDYDLYTLNVSSQPYYQEYHRTRTWVQIPDGVDKNGNPKFRYVLSPWSTGQFIGNESLIDFSPRASNTLNEYTVITNGYHEYTATYTKTTETETVKKDSIVLGTLQNCSWTFIASPPVCKISPRLFSTLNPRPEIQNDGNQDYEIFPLGLASSYSQLNLNNVNTFPVYPNSANSKATIKPHPTSLAKAVLNDQTTAAPTVQPIINNSAYIPKQSDKNYTEQVSHSLDWPGHWQLTWDVQWHTDAYSINWSGVGSNDRSSLTGFVDPVWQGEEITGTFKCPGNIDVYASGDPPTCMVPKTLFEIGDPDVHSRLHLNNPNRVDLQIIKANYIADPLNAATTPTFFIGGADPPISTSSPKIAGKNNVLKEIKSDNQLTKKPKLGAYKIVWDIQMRRGREVWSSRMPVNDPNWTIGTITQTPKSPGHWWDNNTEFIERANSQTNQGCAQDAKDADEVVRVPFFKVYSGDISAGGRFGQSDLIDACDSSPRWVGFPAAADQGIYGYSRLAYNLTDIVGSSVQHGAFTSKAVANVYSDERATNGGGNNELRNTTFANNDQNILFGGNFRGQRAWRCMPNYWQPPQGTLASNSNTLDISDLRDNDRIWYQPTGGELTITDSASANRDKDLKATIYVSSGDIVIKSDIENNHDPNKRYKDFSQMGHIILVVLGGDIRIDPTVSKIDAVLVAQPNPAITTKASGGTINLCDIGQPSTGRTAVVHHYLECEKNDLTINGALIGQRVLFNRIYKTLRDEEATEGTSPRTKTTKTTTNASEMIDLLPEYYIGTPSIAIFSNWSYQADAILELPPNL